METVAPRMPRRPRHALPAGACDAHTHVFGPFDRFPLVAPPRYPPPDVPPATHRAFLDAIGAGRGALIQPAPYGTDARLMLDAIAQAPDRLRGIAVLDSATDEEMAALAAGGIAGLRFNEMRDPKGERHAGAVGVEALAGLAPAMRAHDLHAQLWAPCRDLPPLVDTVLAAGVTPVVDHMGWLPEVDTPADPAFRRLVALLREGRIWVKLSVCRNAPAEAPAYPRVRPFHDALIEANPDRLVWATDWPHVRMGDLAPDAADLVDLFLDWVDDPALRQRILVDNAAALYGF